MKDRLQFVSTIALLFDLCTIWCTFTDRPGESTPLIWASWVLALAVGVMSVVHASRLRRPGWAMILAMVTLCVVGGGSAALADILAHPDGFFPSAVEGIAVPLILLFAEVVPPLVAGLSTELLHPGRQMSTDAATFERDLLIP